MKNDFLTDPDFVVQENCAFQSIQRIFPCEKNLLDKIPLQRIVDHFQSKIIPQESPFLFRIAGQSGSGKSTQLVPALESALESYDYLKINVGAFAQFHPKFQEWQQNDPQHMRENTNGFALKALVLFYKHCILNRVNLILDMTLLEPEIDLYLMTLAKKMGYQIQLHVLCVPKIVSDYFIRQRQKQTGRFVKASSSDYFFMALAPSLKCLTRQSIFDKNDRLLLWTHTKTYPVQNTCFYNKSVLMTLAKYRQRRNTTLKKPNKLLKAKKYWMHLVIQGVIHHV